MLKSKLKTEIETIYLTSDDKKFININKALRHEIMIELEVEKKRRKNKMTDDQIKSVVEVLSRNDWGVFFKGEPITALPVQDGTKVYKVNEVKIEAFLSELMECFAENKEEECQDHQINRNQTNREL